MEPFARAAGGASAVIGLIQYGLGGLASAAVGLLHDGTAVPMAGVAAACGLASLTALVLLAPSHHYEASAEPTAVAEAMTTATPPD